jgi:hypothetical protein
VDALEYKAVAEGIRTALYDMEDWPEQSIVTTVTGRIVERLCQQFTSHDKDFNRKMFTDAIYEEASDEDIPF